MSAATISDERLFADRHEGAVIVEGNGRLHITGRQIGGVSVLEGGELLLSGHLEGALWVARGGHALIDAGGTHCGELLVEGTLSRG